MSFEKKHKIIAATVAAVVLTSGYLMVGSNTTTTQVQENKGLSIEVSNKPIDASAPTSAIAPAVSVDSPAPVSAAITAESEGCPGIIDNRAFITASAWFTMSDDQKQLTKLVLDGNCAMRQVINGELATTNKLVIPFGSLFNLYVKGIETKNSGLLKDISEQATPKNKSVEGFIRLYQVAPPQGWETTQKVSTLINVPEFILSLREKMIKDAKDSGTGSGRGVHGFISSENIYHYLSNHISHEPNADFTLAFIYMTLGGSVDFQGLCVNDDLRNPGANKDGQATDDGKFYFSDVNGGSWRMLNLLIPPEQIGTKTVKQNGQNVPVVFISCKHDEIT